MCIQSHPGLYDEGTAYWREAKTKIASYCFWYLGCWSKGQIFSKKLDNPYIQTQHHLTADTNRLLVLHRSSMKWHTLEWCFSPTRARGLQLRQQHLSCMQQSSQASLKAWAQHSPPIAKPTLLLSLLSYKPPSKHLHRDKASPCAKTQKSHLVL